MKKWELFLTLCYLVAYIAGPVKAIKRVNYQPSIKSPDGKPSHAKSNQNLRQLAPSPPIDGEPSYVKSNPNLRQQMDLTDDLPTDEPTEPATDSEITSPMESTPAGDGSTIPPAGPAGFGEACSKREDCDSENFLDCSPSNHTCVCMPGLDKHPRHVSCQVPFDQPCGQAVFLQLKKLNYDVPGEPPCWNDGVCIGINGNMFCRPYDEAGCMIISEKKYREIEQTLGPKPEPPPEPPPGPPPPAPPPPGPISPPEPEICKGSELKAPIIIITLSVALCLF